MVLSNDADTKAFKSNLKEKSSELSTAQIEMFQMGLDDINNGNIISKEELAIEDVKWMV